VPANISTLEIWKKYKHKGLLVINTEILDRAENSSLFFAPVQKLHQAIQPDSQTANLKIIFADMMELNRAIFDHLSVTELAVAKLIDKAFYQFISKTTAYNNLICAMSALKQISKRFLGEIGFELSYDLYKLWLKVDLPSANAMLSQLHKLQRDYILRMNRMACASQNPELALAYANFLRSNDGKDSFNEFEKLTRAIGPLNLEAAKKIAGMATDCFKGSDREESADSLQIDLQVYSDLEVAKQTCLNKVSLLSSYKHVVKAIAKINLEEAKAFVAKLTAGDECFAAQLLPKIAKIESDSSLADAKVTIEKISWAVSHNKALYHIIKKEICTSLEAAKETVSMMTRGGEDSAIAYHAKALIKITQMTARQKSHGTICRVESPDDQSGVANTQDPLFKKLKLFKADEEYSNHPLWQTVLAVSEDEKLCTTLRSQIFAVIAAEEEAFIDINKAFKTLEVYSSRGYPWHFLEVNSPSTIAIIALLKIAKLALKVKEAMPVDKKSTRS
jgi:hypothetical protein